MAELEKMKRVAAREVEGAPHENSAGGGCRYRPKGLEQARQFLKVGALLASC